MTDALKPCPFCGGDNLYNAHPANAADCGVIACRTCGAEGPDAGPPREHIAAWNRRADLPVSVARELTVERVEMEDWGEGYAAPADPIWRIVINGYCADFPTETAARNFANAIGALAPVSVAEAKLRARCVAPVEAYDRENWMRSANYHGDACSCLRCHVDAALRTLAAQEDT